MLNRILSLIIILLLACGSSWAKTSGKTAGNKKSTDEKTAADKEPDFIAKLTFSMPSLKLGIQHYEEQDETEQIEYSPNVRMSWGIDLSYKGYGFSYSMELSTAAKDTGLYGKTEYRDYQVYYYSSGWGADIYYQKYSGYYLENPETFGQVQGDSVSLRPDMKMQSAGFNLYFAFNDEFSFNNAMKCIFTGNGWKSSFLLMVSPNYFRVDSGSSLLPPSEEALYGDEAGFKKGEYYSLSVSPGYACSEKFSNNLFFTFIVFGGIGGMSKSTTNDSGKTKEAGVCIKANVKFNFGYDSTHFFCGLTGLGDGTSTRNPFADSDSSIMSYVLKAEIFAGVRF